MSARMVERVALVTGAGSGIGQAVCAKFAQQHHRVVAVDIRSDGLPETCALVEEGGGEVVPVTADVSREEDAETMVKAAIERFGRLDAAVNCAGITERVSLSGDRTSFIRGLDAQEWRRVVEVNLTGTFLGMKYQIPAMSPDGGAIVNISSGAGLMGLIGLPAYTASKHGVLGLTKVAALECASLGIRVNAVCPGTTMTPLMLATQGASVEALRETTPLGRPADPSEIADAVVWLCGEGASYVTGATLPVDGGTTVRHPRSGLLPKVES